MTNRRKRLILVGCLMVALAITLVYGFRLARHLTDRPPREPIRPWMSVPHIAAAYGVPPEHLFEALGLQAAHPVDLRPIGEIARAQNRSIEEVIRILEERLQRGPPERQPPDGAGTR